jgi:hypothetical protein
MTGFEAYTDQAIVEQLRKPQLDIGSNLYTHLMAEGLARLLEQLTPLVSVPPVTQADVDAATAHLHDPGHFRLRTEVDRRHIDSLMTPPPDDAARNAAEEVMRMVEVGATFLPTPIPCVDVIAGIIRKHFNRAEVEP